MCELFDDMSSGFHDVFLNKFSVSLSLPAPLPPHVALAKFYALCVPKSRALQKKASHDFPFGGITNHQVISLALTVTGWEIEAGNAI